MIIAKSFSGRYRGHQRRRLDHVGNRPHKVSQDLRGEAFLFLDERIGTVAAESLLGLGGQPPDRASTLGFASTSARQQLL